MARSALSAAALLAALAAAPCAAATSFGDCLAQLRADALGRGIAPATFDATLAGVEPDQSVLEAMESQPEFRTAIWDYLAGLVDDQRIADGRTRLETWPTVLGDVERKYGVDRHAVVAVWGIETDFGRITGSRALPRSLATGACFGPRQRFFRGELSALLRIVQSGDIPVDSLKGSWAGAFGQTQFMPSTYLRLAVDFDGDGRRDIVGSVPDALASTANYLLRAGWQTGQPWGYEVRLPREYGGPSGRRVRRALAEWNRLGIRRLDGAALSGPESGALLLPAGASGPAFLVFRNFDAIYAYNAAESYALAIAHLSDRLRGAGPFATAWPTDDPGLSRAERREVQERLVLLGYDIGTADGIIGMRTRKAIEAFQAGAGMTPDGRAGARLLKALRGAASPR